MFLAYSISVCGQNAGTRFSYSILRNVDGTNVSKQESKYDDNNNEILRLYSHRNGKEWKESVKYEYDYDYRGNLVASAMFNSDSLGNWTGTVKTDSEFNDDGNVTSNTYYSWMSTQEWGVDYKEVYEYNANNEKTKSIWLFMDENHEWEKMDNGSYTFKYEYGKNGNCMIQNVFNIFGNENEEKYEYRYDMNNNLISSRVYKWDNDSWIEYYLYEYQYDENENQTGEIFSRYNEENQAWQPYTKYVHNYDKNSRLTGVSYFYWNREMQDWDGHYNYEYIHDETGNPVGMNLFIWQNKEWILNEILTYYYDDNYFPENKKEEISVKIYPNPTIDFIHISGAKGAKIVITDTSGRILLTRDNIREPETIPTSSWPSGIYLINIQNAGKLLTKKIIKQ